MAEVLVEFDTRIVGTDGTSWAACACGKLAADGLWDGWIELSSGDPSVKPLCTGRETRQVNRADLRHWAQGLTELYLEAALRRAMAQRNAEPAQAAPGSAHFDSPATHQPATPASPGPRALVNPFEAYQQAEDVLAGILSALDAQRLRDIAVCYGFTTVAQAAARNHKELTATILAGVRGPLPSDGRTASRVPHRGVAPGARRL